MLKSKQIQSNEEKKHKNSTEKKTNAKRIYA